MSANDNDNEDWLRSGSWDLDDIEDTAGLLALLRLKDAPEAEQVAGLRHLMTLPAWHAAPQPLKDQAAAWLQARS
jgi:hypothetical protein